MEIEKWNPLKDPGYIIKEAEEIAGRKWQEFDTQKHETDLQAFTKNVIDLRRVIQLKGKDIGYKGKIKSIISSQDFPKFYAVSIGKESEDFGQEEEIIKLTKYNRPKKIDNVEMESVDFSLTLYPNMKVLLEVDTDHYEQASYFEKPENSNSSSWTHSKFGNKLVIKARLMQLGPITAHFLRRITSEAITSFSPQQEGNS